jgi:hypothetical protein
VGERGSGGIRERNGRASGGLREAALDGERVCVKRGEEGRAEQMSTALECDVVCLNQFNFPLFNPHPHPHAVPRPPATPHHVVLPSTRSAHEGRMPPGLLVPLRLTTVHHLPKVGFVPVPSLPFPSLPSTSPSLLLPLLLLLPSSPLLPPPLPHPRTSRESVDAVGSGSCQPTTSPGSSIAPAQIAASEPRP